MLITVDQSDIFEYKGTKTPASLRFYADEDFLTDDDVYIEFGSPTHPQFYQDVAVNLVGTTVQTVAGDIHSTVASNKSGVTYTVALYDTNGRRIATILEGVRIDDTPSVQTWADIVRFSSDTNPTPLPPTAYTKTEMDAILAGYTSTALKATNAQYGVTRLDTAPAVTGQPIAVGVNSPLMTNVALIDPVILAADKRTEYLEKYASMTAAVAAIGATPTELKVTNPYSVNTTDVLPATILLSFEGKGSLIIGGGNTLTIGAMRDPGSKRVFSGAGAVRLARGAVPAYNTVWWTGPTSGVSIDGAFTDIFASATANHGGHVIIPEGTWLSAGNQNIPLGVTIEGSSRRGIANYATEIKLTAATRPLFKLLPGTYEVRLKNMTLNGDSQANTQGLLATGTAGVDDIVSGIYIEGCTIMNFTDGVYLHGISDWQVRQFVVDRTTVFALNSQSGIRVTTSNSNLIVAADFFVPNAAHGIWVEAVGGLEINNSEFGFIGTPAYGQEQVEKQIVAGSVTVAGTAKSVVTGVPGGPITVNVPVTTADTTAGAIADKFRRALAKDPTIAAYCHVLGLNGNAEIQLAKIDPAADDATFNFTIETGTATGVTNSLTSTNEAAGVATTSIAESAINVTGKYAFIGMYNTQDEGCKYTIKHNYANTNDGNIVISNSLVLGRVAMMQGGRLTLQGVVLNPKLIRDAAAGSTSVVTAVGCSAGANPYIGGSFRASEQRIHNFSDIVGLNASTITEINANNAFTFPTSVFQSSARFTQPAGAWYRDPLDPWISILGTLNNQRLLQLGRATASGFADFYYNFYRKNDSGDAGRLKIEGNQTGFIGLDFNGDIYGSGAIRGGLQVVAYAASVTLNPRDANHFSIAMTGNMTLNMTSLTDVADDFLQTRADGQVLTIELIQDATGSRLLTLSSGAGQFAFGTDITAATLTTTASKRDILTVRYSKRANRWMVIGFVKGYA